MSVNAYNLWALFPVDGQSMATSRGWIYDAPVADATSWASIGPFPAAAVGGALLALLLFVVVPVLVARRPDRLTILVGVSVLALAFFAVPTRVHERYLFPLFAIAAIPFAFSWRWRIFYVVASIATFLNMYAVLTTIYPDNPSISDWLGIGDAITSQAGVTLIAADEHRRVPVGPRPAAPARPTDVRRGARARARARHVGRATGPRAGAGRRDRLRRGARAGRAGVAGHGSAGHRRGRRRAAAGAGVLAAAPARLVPAWFDRPGWTDIGPIGWIRTRINETPIRPDRSRLLSTEGRGRLDRLDLWILIVLVVSAMCLRTFRLAEPARMHFDEVYHARTAAEFLQDWRYGLSHYIYEWTHPHLAKYAMAGGIVAVRRARHLGHEQPRHAGPGRGDRAPPPRPPLGDGPGRRPGVDRDRHRPRGLRPRRRASSSPPGRSPARARSPTTPTATSCTSAPTAASCWRSTRRCSTATRAAARTSCRSSPSRSTTLDGAISHLATFDGGGSVAAILPGDTVTIVDPGSGDGDRLVRRARAPST